MSAWKSAEQLGRELGIGGAGVRYRAENDGGVEMRDHPTHRGWRQYRLTDAPASATAPDDGPHLLDLGAPPPRADDGDEPIEALLLRRLETFRRSRKAHDKRRAVVRIERDRPFAVCHMGDPHVDDDGCDLEQLIRDVETVQRTPGMYAGNVGDTVNNWVGKLVGKWKQQSTTEDEAFRLGRWLFEAVGWDYVLLGNHDHWNQGGQIFRLFAEGADIRALADHEARVEYVGPGGGTFRLDVRHDFKGHSMWNNVHGPMKRAKIRPWADLYVCGHKHTWGVHVDEQETRGPVWAVRVRGYKRMDEYAEAKDFSEDRYGCSLTTVIQPDHPHPGERAKVFHDVEEAASFLKWLRARAS